MDVRIKKAEAVLTVDRSKYPEHVKEFLFNYGERQFYNDSISSLSREGTKSTTKASPEEMMAAVTETRDRLYAGETRATRAVDTLGKMAFNLALKKVMNIWLAKHKGGNPVKDYPSARADAQAEYVKNQEKYDAAAQSLIELTSGEDVE